MPDYLTVEDFLTYDAQMTRKIGRVNDTVETVREQLDNLTVAFKNYVAETDTYRLANDQRLGNIDTQLADLRSELADMKQAMSRGFTLIFAHLGIQP
jgi:uncharacterized phage infection (PIP) family protein YhgE